MRRFIGLLIFGLGLLLAYRASLPSERDDVLFYSAVGVAFLGLLIMILPGGSRGGGGGSGGGGSSGHHHGHGHDRDDDRDSGSGGSDSGGGDGGGGGGD